MTTLRLVDAQAGDDARDYLLDLQSRVKQLELRVRADEDRRRAMLHIMSDLADTNRRLNSQRRAMIHIMGDLRDTTEEIRRHEQELREKQEQLVQTAKLATLGQLTTGVAHELNDPLNNIGLFIGNVLDALGLGTWDRARIERDLDRARQQLSKASEIINHLRVFGRTAPTRREPVEINAIIKDSVSLFNEQFRLREIDLILELADENPRVLGNSIQLEQVLLNLVNNARDALDGSKKKEIRICSGVDGANVVLAVEDSGPGISAEIESKIFEPFFTTKEAGEGTGLGLSIVSGIVRDHNGEIYVDRATNGARFVIRLPIEPDGA